MKKQTLLFILFFTIFSMVPPMAFAYSSRVAAPLGTTEYSPSSLPVSPGRGYKRRVSPARKSVVKNTSSPSFIRFKCANMNFRSFEDLGEIKTVLGPKSIVQLPNFPKLGIQVHEYNQDGSLDFDKTIENWIQMAKHRSSELGSRHLIPRSFRGQLYLPVKVIRASDSRFNTNGPDAYGYLALDFIRKKVNPRCYTATTKISSEMLSENEIIGGRPVSNGEFNGQHSETTHNGDFLDPEQRENFGDLSQSRIFNCDNTRYRQNGYSRHSCLKDMSFEKKAQLVMKDVSKINELRPGLKLDPRFSLCIAYRESTFSPNAQGSSNDSGMYQVTDSTARYVLEKHRPVIPHFSKYRRDQQYKAAMLRSTLAQADLHHMVVYQKASDHGLLDRINRNPEDVRLLQRLAVSYNGSRKSRRARRYGQKVANCYRAMQQVASIDGEIHNPSGLRKALERAKG